MTLSYTTFVITAVRYCSITELARLLDEEEVTKASQGSKIS